MNQQQPEFDINLPRSPWEVPGHMLRDDGTMICAIWLPTQKGSGVDVQWGPYGFQKTYVAHQDPYSGRDCRACRHLFKTAAQATLMRRKFELQVAGLFALRMSESGEITMVPVKT